MLALNFDDVEFLNYPVIVQPKLNGIRAKWDGKNLISRQRKVWSERSLPTVISELKQWSAFYPDYILDGELYIHGFRFQEIEEVAAVKRVTPHEHESKLKLHAFDLISNDHTEERLIKLSQSYSFFVGVTRANNEQEVRRILNACIEFGYEGLMIRQLGCPYLPNRTEALLKLKPLQYGFGIVVEVIEGQGKFKDMVGAFKVRFPSERWYFNIGGGNMTDEQRKEVWENRDLYVNRRIRFSCTEISKAGVPQQGKIIWES